MQTFEFYGLVWLAYIGLGIIFLSLIAYKTKNLAWPVKFAILSFLAVGAFTPDSHVEAQTYAPLVITALLKAEIEGSKAIISGLIQLTIIWGIIFFIGMSLRQFLLKKKS